MAVYDCSLWTLGNTYIDKARNVLTMASISNATGAEIAGSADFHMVMSIGPNVLGTAYMTTLNGLMQVCAFPVSVPDE